MESNLSATYHPHSSTTREQMFFLYLCCLCFVFEIFVISRSIFSFTLLSFLGVLWRVCLQYLSPACRYDFNFIHYLKIQFCLKSFWIIFLFWSYLLFLFLFFLPFMAIGIYIHIILSQFYIFFKYINFYTTSFGDVKLFIHLY